MLPDIWIILPEVRPKMINVIGMRRREWSSSDMSDNTGPLIVNSCGYEKFLTRDMHVERRNGRSDYNIIYIVNGSGEFGAAVAQKGSVIVFAPGQPQVYTYRAADHTEVYWVHFTGYDAVKHLESNGLGAAMKSSLAGAGIMTDINDECISLFKKMLHEYQLKEPMFENRAAGILIEIMSLFGRRAEYFKTGRKMSTGGPMSKALEEMQRNFHKNLPVKYYADISNLSFYRFLHNFKEVTGMTPAGYIRQMRMDKAKYLLSSNVLMNVAEISYSIGYNDPLYFSRVFREEAGVSPSQYRKLKTI